MRWIGLLMVGLLAGLVPSAAQAQDEDVPDTPGGVVLHLHVDDTDETVRRAVEAGASVDMEPTDQFYGERSATIRDPYGHRWTIGHHLEDVSPEEMQRRYTALMTGD